MILVGVDLLFSLLPINHKPNVKNENIYRFNIGAL